MPLDKKSFWSCWAAVVAPHFAAHGVVWKGKDSQQGKIARADDRNILVSVTLNGRLDPDWGGDFAVGIAVSESDHFDEARQFNVMPAAVDLRYERLIKATNTKINARIRDELSRSDHGLTIMADHGVAYLLRNASSSSHRVRDECDMQIWAEAYFGDYAKAAIEFALHRAV